MIASTEARLGADRTNTGLASLARPLLGRWFLVHPLMRQLVDGRTLRASGVVAHAEGEEYEDRPSVGLELEHEDHPEAPVGRR